MSFNNITTDGKIFFLYWVFPVIAVVVPVVWYLASKGYLQVFYTPVK